MIGLSFHQRIDSICHALAPKAIRAPYMVRQRNGYKLSNMMMLHPKRLRVTVIVVLADTAT